MPTSKQGRHPAVSVTLDKLREHLGMGAESDSTMLPWTEEQRETLLRVIPDQVFRVKLQQDGSVSITGNCTRAEPRSRAASWNLTLLPCQYAPAACRASQKQLGGDPVCLSA